jgi:CBS domain-containing protein
MRAKDIMTTNVATVTADASVETIAKLMLARNISGVPVVDGSGALLGIVTEGDLMHRQENEAAPRTSWWLRFLSDSETDAGAYVKTHGMRAGDVMSRDVMTVGEDTPVGDIARILAVNHIKRVPVMRDGAIVGIVSRANLLRGLATRDESRAAASSVDDGAIKEAIVKAVDSQGWVTHGSLNVIVTGAVVELWGWVESEQERRALLLLAETVDGVKEVEDHLGSIPRYLQSD